MLQSDSRIRVRGRLASAHGVVFGVIVSHPSGGFAGNFFTFKPAVGFESGQYFDILLEVRDFQLDPALAHMRDELAMIPSEVVVETFWCNTLADPAGLEVFEVEIVSPAPNRR